MSAIYDDQRYFRSHRCGQTNRPEYLVLRRSRALLLCEAAGAATFAEADRLTGKESLTPRIELPGRVNGFRELAVASDAMLAEVEAQIETQ
jgi:hypothetical protein